MEQLNSIVSLAFSPTNWVQAAVIAVILSFYLQKYSNIWNYALLGLFIDWFCVPVAHKAIQGFAIGDLISMFWALIISVPSDLGILSVRLVGIMMMLSIAFGFRFKVRERLA